MPRSIVRMFAIAVGVFAVSCVDAAYAESPQEELIHYNAGEGKYPFTPAVRAGSTVYLSGQIGQDSNGLGKDFDTQARLAMDNIVSAAKLAGIGPGDIAKCTVMLADMKNWETFNKIYRSYFHEGKFPARSAFGVTGLALGAQLEVECIGYVATPGTAH